MRQQTLSTRVILCVCLWVFIVRVVVAILLLSIERSVFVSVVSTVTQTLQWLASVQRVPVEIIARLVAVNQHAEARVPSRFVKKVRPQMVVSGGDGRWGTIAEWCVEQDLFVVIGRYVDLDRNGIGCCPFGWHHSDGQDSHPSLVVYAPSASSIMCWYCLRLEAGRFGL